MKIGVLALQGAVAEHIRLIEKAGGEGIIRKAFNSWMNWMESSFPVVKVQR